MARETNGDKAHPNKALFVSLSAVVLTVIIGWAVTMTTRQFAIENQQTALHGEQKALRADMAAIPQLLAKMEDIQAKQSELKTIVNVSLSLQAQLNEALRMLNDHLQSATPHAASMRNLELRVEQNSREVEKNRTILEHVYIRQYHGGDAPGISPR